MFTPVWRAAPLALAALLAAPLAHAETPEEAVGYAFLGLADGATLARGSTHLAWKESSTSPAVFVGHGEGGAKTYDVTFTITKVADCDYEIYLAGPAAMVRGGKALYAKVGLATVTGISAGPTQVKIEGGGFCQTGQVNPNCVPVPATDLFGTIDPEKHLRIVEQIRAEACIKSQ